MPLRLTRHEYTFRGNLLTDSSQDGRCYSGYIRLKKTPRLKTLQRSRDLDVQTHLNQVSIDENGLIDLDLGLKTGLKGQRSDCFDAKHRQMIRRVDPFPGLRSTPREQDAVGDRKAKENLSSRVEPLGQASHQRDGIWNVLNDITQRNEVEFHF